jgi:hypothetical protein
MPPSATYDSGEYAILVGSDLKGRGLGWLLMQMIIEYACAEGLRRIEGQVLAENTTMLAMCRELGFTVSADAQDLGHLRCDACVMTDVVRIELRIPQTTMRKIAPRICARARTNFVPQVVCHDCEEFAGHLPAKTVSSGFFSSGPRVKVPAGPPRQHSSSPVVPRLLFHSRQH